ncbi:MAG: hypothetical protein ACKVQT_14965 [Burkholderiales bacterium]
MPLVLHLLAALLVASPTAARAHDIPDQIGVQGFIKPEGRTPTFLVRVPLKAMRDVDVPQRAGGFLDFARAERALRDAATLWLANEIELYEGDARLGVLHVADTRVSLGSHRTFQSYEQTLAYVSAPRLGNDTELYWNQGLLDVPLEYSIASERGDFSIRPRLERLGLRVNTALRVMPPE